MSEPRLRLLVEGWRGIAHSYALVNQYQLAALASRSDVELRHRDLPFYGDHWRPVAGLLPADVEARVRAVRGPEVGWVPEAVLRVAYPYRFAPPEAGRLFVFGTAESGLCPPGALEGDPSGNMAAAMDGRGAVLVTPSEWSRRGFLRSGAPEGRVVVVPHGVDTSLFRPLEPEARRALRVRLGWAEDAFVFLNVGNLSPNKGAVLLVEAFARVARRQPRARLVLKYNQALYSAKGFLEALKARMSEQTQALLASRLVLLGGQHSLADVACLHQAADAYAAPYYAEGFNLPALEACACGLPVLCTAGGPTDEFLSPECLLAIRSRTLALRKPEGEALVLEASVEHLETLMDRVMADGALRETARVAGPAHVAASYTWPRVVERLVALLRRPADGS